MKLAVQFASVFYRGGPAAITELVQGMERLGFDQIDMFDHVTMEQPKEGRDGGGRGYPATMPLLEALTSLSYFAAVTSTIGLGTEVLILPQRQPALVAKQVATVDILSGGRVRLGIGVGWQPGEYESLGVPFAERGRRMDEAIDLLRAYWTEPSISYQGRHHTADAMAMEPKPRDGRGGPPIWMGGSAPAALRRIGRSGDGWLAGGGETVASAQEKIALIRAAAEGAGRDPATLGYQIQLGDPRDMDAMAKKAVQFQEAGFGWGTVSMTALYTAGNRTADAQLEALGLIRDRLVRELGTPL